MFHMNIFLICVKYLQVQPVTLLGNTCDRLLSYLFISTVMSVRVHICAIPAPTCGSKKKTNLVDLFCQLSKCPLGVTVVQDIYH